MKTIRNDWTLPLKMVCLIMLLLPGTVPDFVAEAQIPRRVVAVYQFNSVIPDISGPLARELFIGALVRSGKFAIAPPNAAGAEYIFDGAISESKAAKGSMKGVLKDLLAGEQAAISFDVRIVEARSGVLLDYVNVTTREMVARKLKLTDVLDGMKSGNPSVQNKATTDLLSPYITEAVNRIAAKYGPAQAAGLNNFPQQGGFAQPGYPNPSDPYQSGYPSNPMSTPGYNPSGYPSTQYPSQLPPAQGYPQQGYPSTQYPPAQPGQGYPQTGYPSTQYPSSQYPPMDPNQPGYPSSTQPGYPSAQNPYGIPGAPGSQPGYPPPPYPSQPQGLGGAAPGQVQPRGIDDPPPSPMADLLAKFDPAEHEVADARGKPGQQLRDGSNLIHTDASGHKLFAIVEGGNIVDWSAADALGNTVPLILMGNESSCWECAMSPGLCWKVSCALEDIDAPSPTPK